MSAKDRLAGLTRGIGNLPTSSAPSSSGTDDLPPKPIDTEGAVATSKARTVPGQLFGVRGAMIERDAELAALRDKLLAFEGAAPARAVDSATVGVSIYANRHEDEFSSEEFAELRQEISNAGRNVQPIMVRRLAARGKVVWEVVFGHRRLRACQDLGICVWIIEVELSDQDLFKFMDMENRGRKNPSPWELGDSYRRALEGKLYPSLRQLAAELGIEVGYASRALALATLPKEVLDAFPSRLDLQFRWGKDLSDALQKDPEAVIERAKRVKAEGHRMGAAQVLRTLLGQGDSQPKKIDLRAGPDAKIAGSLVVDAKGAISLKLRPGSLDAAKVKVLESAVVKLLAG